MESLIPILIGLVWIILRAVASNNKKKQSAARPPLMPQGHPQSVPPIRPPAHNPFEEWMKSFSEEEDDGADEIVEERKKEEPQKGIQKEISVEKQLYPSSLDLVARPTLLMKEDEEETAAEADSKLPKKPAVQTEAGGVSGIASTFDVKKAVIYSEILRPKFEVE